ncbi:MAG TPA: hypothetical protein VG426_16820 [Candidatus Dormibacteraeota bacterium]|jgi:hypothetical protein|nr:hypothetical protein [Candidatus Dormibacteraeota bacterium]
MCVLCGDLVGDPHWTERSVQGGHVGGFAGETNRRQARYRRTRILNSVLRSNNLSVHEDLSGTNYVLGNGKGSQEVVQHLGQLWPAADKLAGRRLDPLDDGLLTALEKRS